MWMRLDTDFYRDPKFLGLVSAKGKSAGYDAVLILALATDRAGKLDLNDDMERAWVENEMGMKGKRLTKFLESLAEYHLIDPEEFERGIVTSRRLKEEADITESYREQKRRAAKARWEKR